MHPVSLYGARLMDDGTPCVGIPARCCCISRHGVALRRVRKRGGEDRNIGAGINQRVRERCRIGANAANHGWIFACDEENAHG